MNLKSLKNGKILSLIAVIRRWYSLLEVPWRRIHNAIAKAMSICVAYSNKVMDILELPQTIKRHEALKYGICSVGHSMIEMLGVLAIIGVLSVGGIAGYSKAMEKFKHNKWLQQIETLSFSIQDLYKNQTKYANSGNNDIIPLLKSIGALPQDMLDKNNNDILGNRVSAYVSTWHNWIRPHFQFDTSPSYNALQTCLDLFHLPLDIASIWTVTFCAGKNCWDNWEYRICGTKLPADYLEIVPECKYQTAYNRVEIIKNCKICVQEYCTFLVISGNTIY